MFTKAEQLDPNGYMTVAYIAWHKMHIKDYAAAKKYFERVSPLDDPSTSENESEKGSSRGVRNLRQPTSPTRFVPSTCRTSTSSWSMRIN